MEMVQRKRLVLKRMLDERRKEMPRPAQQFLETLLGDDVLLERMHFCRTEERSRLHNSVLISIQDVQCWSVLLNNDPDGAKGGQARALMALEGLELTPGQVLDHLRPLPVWFLAVDPEFELPPAGEAPQLDRTIYRMTSLPGARLRRLAIMDQIDAALDAGDRDAYGRLQTLLGDMRTGK